ncbi:MAG: hypothetical protein MUC96_37330 [Myxococcaceae bacterium]|nr:hypothetical protein [Myxococcaceae bacterium]
MKRPSQTVGVWVLAGLVLGGCPNLAPNLDVDPDTEVQPPFARDAGRPTVVAQDAGPGPMVWTAAGENCPPESFGRITLDDGGVEDTPDGAVVFGLCVALRSATGQVLLNQRPAAGVKFEFRGGRGVSEWEGALPSTTGQYDVKVMRANYDIFYYQPAGVFLTHEGLIDTGPIDLRNDQVRRLEATSHTLAGSALFGGLPFVPTRAPDDIGLETTGASRLNSAANQRVSTQSQAGSYELKLLSGQFALFLNAPPRALYGTELRRYMVSPSQLVFDRDQAFDIDIPTATLEGEVLMDGMPLPDRRPGADFTLSYTIPGERTASVRTHHEGGYETITGMVPRGEYGVGLSFIGAPDRSYPAEVSNVPLVGAIDLRTDRRLNARIDTVPVEGSLSIDGVPVVPRPTYAWNMFMYGFSSAANSDVFVEFQVPLESSSFSLRTFTNNYFVVLQMSDELAEDLVDGWFIVNRLMPIMGPSRLPINIDTGYYQGRLTIDGKPPPAGVPVGTFYFANRSPEYRNSFFLKRAVTAEDGQFRVRLPRGSYDVFFVIDTDLFPEYARGFTQVAAQILIDPDAAVNDDIRYDTVLVTGPLRVGGQVVRDTLGRQEVGLELERFDGRSYRWGFFGGGPNYRMRLPPGEYKDLRFIIERGAIDGVAWGEAEMGGRLQAGTTIGPSLSGQ